MLPCQLLTKMMPPFQIAARQWTALRHPVHWPCCCRCCSHSAVLVAAVLQLLFLCLQCLCCCHEAC